MAACVELLASTFAIFLFVEICGTTAEQIGHFTVERVPVNAPQPSITRGFIGGAYKKTITTNSTEADINEVLSGGKPEYIEGDIIPDRETRRFIDQNPNSRNAISWSHGVWPSGVVPYTIDSSIGTRGRTAISKAIADYHRLTCLRFVQRTSTTKNYVRFTYGKGCSSSVGRTNRGMQRINLHRFCWNKGIVIHEMAHAIGFFHEQSRTDRDSYVRVLFHNIKSGHEHNFKKHGSGITQNLGEPYDYGSIMHYGNKAFSKNRQPTIVALRSGGDKMGQRKELSANDIRQINKLYKCRAKPVNPGPNPGSTVYCNFDSGILCQFTQDTADQFDWTITNRASPSGNTGPSGDLSGSGYYVFIEASHPRRTGDRARLVSPRMTGNYCVRFYFHVYGTHIGTLNVYRRVGSRDNRIFTHTGSRGNQWNSAEATVRDSQAYQIVFEGVRGNGYLGDIALDELKFVPGVCKNPVATPPPPPSPPIPVTPRPNSGRCGVRHHGQRSSDSDSRVVAGRPARPNSWPWQIEMIERRLGHYCGGTLVTNRWVVTAAHCVQGKRPSDFHILMGEHDRKKPSSSEQKRNIRRIIKHPGYTNLNNDIALIELDRPVTLNREVNVACLPQQGYSARPGTMCYITGWGRLASNRPSAQILQEAAMPVVGKATCARHMAAVSKRRITQQMICAGFGGSSPISGCFGDSGGPFVCRDQPSNRWVLHGAVSWGSRTCSAGYNQYTVFARVSEFGTWIKRYVGAVTIPPPRPVTPSPPRPVTPRPPVPGGPCPRGWYQYASSCYKHVRTPETWERASSRCRGEGGYLVSLNSDTEANYILRQMSSMSGQFVWGGLRRDSSRRFSTWQDGKSVVLNMWALGEPNNYWGNEDCLEMIHSLGKLQWLDSPCSGRKAKSHPYICERAGIGGGGQGRCSSGWTTPPGSPRGTCYKAFNSPTSWAGANTICRSYSASLVTIGNSAEKQLVRRLVSQRVSYGLWMGLQRIPNTNQFRWSDGTSVGFTSWMKGEPNNYSGNEDCGYTSTITGDWADSVCTRTLPYVCKKGRGSVRPPRPVTAPPRPPPPPSSCGIKGFDLSQPPVGNSGRIVGGQDATPGEWPWQVALMCKGCGSQNCGGSLVSRYHVVTAAHCVTSNTPKYYKVRLGEHHFRNKENFEQDINIAAVYKHPLYNSGVSMNYDVAVLKLASPAQLTSHVKPVCLNSRPSSFPPGSKCYITGWGRLAINRPGSLILKEAITPLVSNTACKASYGSNRITPQMFCAGYPGGGIDTCKGDSGGPLVCQRSGRWHLTGITSWGYGCARPRFYGVYTNVGSVYSWIVRQMK